MVTTIIAYQFTQLSRQEVEAMLGLNIQETRLYQEAKEDGAREVMELSREEIEARLSLDIEDTPIYQEGRQEGSQAEAVRLVQRLLRRRLGEVPDEVLAQVRALALPQLEDLGEALLDVTTLAELTTWLQSQGQND